MKPEVALIIGLFIGKILTYIPMRIRIKRLENRIHQMVKDRNMETMERYMRKLNGGE